MYWICVRCSETYYTSDTSGYGDPQPCGRCGACVGATFDEDPELGSGVSLLVDECDRVIALSREMETLAGWTELEAMGLPVEEMFSAVGPDMVYREIETLTGSRLIECHVGVAIS